MGSVAEVGVRAGREEALVTSTAADARQAPAVFGVRSARYGSPGQPETGVVSFRIEGFDVALTGALLDER